MGKNKTVGDFIREFREKHLKLKHQNQLAKKLGKDPSYVSRWESGEKVIDADELDAILKLGNTSLGKCLFLPGEFYEAVADQVDAIEGVTEVWRERGFGPKAEDPKRPPNRGRS